VGATIVAFPADKKTSGKIPRSCGVHHNNEGPGDIWGLFLIYEHQFDLKMETQNSNFPGITMN